MIEVFKNNFVYIGMIFIAAITAYVKLDYIEKYNIEANANQERALKELELRINAHSYERKRDSDERFKLLETDIVINKVNIASLKAKVEMIGSRK